tara:strand:+ start:30 stop:1553 length:1524 start_codon:yes stop_codon:yes gene_type:complete
MEEVTKWFEGQLRHARGKGALQYLEDRSFDVATLVKFRIGYAPPGNILIREFHRTRGVPLKDLEEVGLVASNEERAEPYDRFRDRIIFPIMNKKSQIIGFGGRRLGSDKGPKYLNSPETRLFHKGAELYGLHLAAKSKDRGKPVIVCEGYTDVMSLYQAGYERVVAPLGTAITSTQISLLWRLSKTPVLCFDGDIAGVKAAQRAAETSLPILTAEKTLQFLSLPEGEDPASLINKGGRSHFHKLLETKGKPTVSVLWQSCLPESPPKTPEERAKIKKKISALCSQIKDSDLKDSYYAALQEFYQSYLKRRLSYHSETSKQASWQKNKWQGKFETPDVHSLPVERPELNAAYMREAILLYTLLNFPALIQEYEEEIAHFQTSSASLQKLKACLLEMINDYPDLDRNTLKAHLYERQFKNIVDELQGGNICIHASFARSDKDLSEVRPLFEEYLKADCTHRPAFDDMKNQAEIFATKMSVDQWDRIKYRRELIASNLSEAENRARDQEK